MAMKESRICRQIILAVTVFVIAIGQASGQSVDVQTIFKIGYLNANTIITEAPQGKSKFDDLKLEFADRETNLNQMEESLNELEAEIQSGESETSLSDLRNSYRQLEREYERETQHFEEDFNIRRNEKLIELQNEVSDVILQFAKDNGFDLIVQDPVVWASDQINITNDILDRLNELHNSEQ